MRTIKRMTVLLFIFIIKWVSPLVFEFPLANFPSSFPPPVCLCFSIFTMIKSCEIYTMYYIRPQNRSISWHFYPRYGKCYNFNWISFVHTIFGCSRVTQFAYKERHSHSSQLPPPLPPFHSLYFILINIVRVPNIELVDNSLYSFAFHSCKSECVCVCEEERGDECKTFKHTNGK